MDSISSLILTNRFISNLVDILEYMTTILCNEKAAEDFYIELENKKDLILKFPRIGTLVNNSLVKKNYKVRKIPINSYNLFYYYDKGRDLVYFVDIQSMLKSDKGVIISIKDFYHKSPKYHFL